MISRREFGVKKIAHNVLCCEAKSLQRYSGFSKPPNFRRTFFSRNLCRRPGGRPPSRFAVAKVQPFSEPPNFSATFFKRNFYAFRQHAVAQKDKKQKIFTKKCEKSQANAPRARDAPLPFRRRHAARARKKISSLQRKQRRQPFQGHTRRLCNKRPRVPHHIQKKEGGRCGGRGFCVILLH